MIDFFIVDNEIIVVEKIFGLCDDTDGSKKRPAYVALDDKNKWIAEVINDNSKEISFYPLDCCVRWNLVNGEPAKVCDAMLSYNEQKNIIFIELKDRNPKHKQWRIRAEEQLKSTIECYKTSYPKSSAHVKAYVSNKQLLFEEGNEEYMERFKEETGITLRYSRKINII